MTIHVAKQVLSAVLVSFIFFSGLLLRPRCLMKPPPLPLTRPCILSARMGAMSWPILENILSRPRRNGFGSFREPNAGMRYWLKHNQGLMESK